MKVNDKIESVNAKGWHVDSSSAHCLYFPFALKYSPAQYIVNKHQNEEQWMRVMRLSLT